MEEFIDGWNLDEYCREEYWKLRRREVLDNGKYKIISYDEYSLDEKRLVKRSYNYESIIKYHDQILLFMINLCEILEFVTEQKEVLHLDIKPENIMVTKNGREIVLIDFGRSKEVTDANRFADSELTVSDYRSEETVEMPYQYGTLGYAAPECYAKATADSQFPFSTTFNQGRMSIESDIFSFGATFWECLNIFELITSTKQFSGDSHDFYREHFLNDDTYMNRDLSCTSIYYHKKLESIIKKCTRKRTAQFTNLENKEYYHSYNELRRDIEHVRDSAPTIVKEENIRANNFFKASGGLLAASATVLIIVAIYRFMAFSIAESRWKSLTENYNDTKFYKMEEISKDLLSSANSNRIDDVYAQIASFTYKDGDISDKESEMLVDLLNIINDDNLLPQRIDEIMKNANARHFKAISTQIVKFDNVRNCIGYDLAKAIFNAEVANTDIVLAYDTLDTYKDNIEFHNAVVKLKNVLDNDEYISVIVGAKGLTRTEVQNFLKSIT